MSLKHFGLISSIVLFYATFSANASFGKNIYLNGIDISGARGQVMQNVNIHINENGDIMITAPHYQVNEEDNYMPLSRYVEGLNKPHHKKPAQVPSVKKTDMAKSLEVKGIEGEPAVVNPEAKK